MEIESEGMGHALFKEWLFEVCVPSIKDYLDTNDLPLNALLLLDNAPGHPKGLEDNLLTDLTGRNLWRSKPGLNCRKRPCEGVLYKWLTRSTSDISIYSALHKFDPVSRITQFEKLSIKLLLIFDPNIIYIIHKIVFN